MSILRISLFGKINIRLDDNELTGLEHRKVQELFCYLLIHRNRQHPRELLANLLWGDCSTAQSKKYLRQALWHLHRALDTLPGASPSMLNVDANWVSLDANSDLELDIAIFEEAFLMMQKCKDRELAPELAQKIQLAIALYRGDLLDGWYQDWCLFERERLQIMHLAMLGRLMNYCEGQQLYEASLAYGTEILRYDSASERTHRDLMRLQYLAGDRTAALRQYERCVAALARELDIKPSQRTVELCDQIRGDSFHDAPKVTTQVGPRKHSISENVAELIGRLRQAQSLLVQLHSQMEQDIAAIESALREQT